ncbi:MAG: hypothetical protein HYY58_03915 [Candidatus Omnitrophica bacterium]|nr:hypothetical protein [Candidatus Omnitrophota bacterium]
MRRWLSRLGVVGRLSQYLWRERLWWLIPFVSVLLLLGLLLLAAQSSPLAPFIYTLF